MIERKKKMCKSCGKEKYLFSKGMCRHCWSLSKLSDKPKNARSASKGTYTIPKRKKLSDKDVERREIMKGFVKDSTSQVEMFKDIVKEALSKGKVKCFVSGLDITHILKGERWMSCCAHVLRKSSFPRWKLKKDNIRLLHPDVHHLVDNWLEEYRDQYPYDFDTWFDLQKKFKKEYETKNLKLCI